MNSPVTERHSVISHRIGPSGTFALRTVRGSVRIRGAARDDVRVEVRYPGAASETGNPEDDGVLRVVRTDDLLQMDVDEMDGRLSQLARLFGGGRPRVDFDVTMPESATLRLNTVSADADVSGLHGELEMRTVSGDMRIVDISGSLDLQSVSGDASITAGSLTLHATSTSGDLGILADVLHDLHVKTVSGDLRIDGALDSGRPHTIETISGDVELGPVTGVSITMTSVSGSIHSSELGRVDQSRGRGSMVVGDGAARLSFRTMSGDLSVQRPPESVKPGSVRPSSAAANAPAAARAAPAAADTDQPSRPGPRGPRDRTNTASDLDVLQALERGEIDVATAARLLEEHPDA